MSKQILMGRTPRVLLDSCKHQPGELNVQDKTLLTRSECATARRALEENHKTVAPCYNRNFEPFGWAVAIIKDSEYVQYQVEKQNAEILARCVADAKAAAVTTRNAAAANAINENTPAQERASCQS